MKRFIVVVATIVTMVGPATAPVQPGLGLLDAITQMVGETSNVQMWDPVEQRLLGQMGWREFADLLGESPLTGPIPSEAPGCSLPSGASLPAYCGPDVGRGYPPTSPSYPCFDGIAWVAYRHTHGGVAFTSLERGEPLTLRCDCSDPCAVYDWDFVEMSTALSPNVAVGFLADGCYSSEWLLHPDGFCPNSGVADIAAGKAVPDTFLAFWRARGPGVAATFAFGSGPDLWLDVFLGLGPITCYDMPVPVDAPGKCPSPAV